MEDTFDAFLLRQRQRCQAKAQACLTRLRRKRREAVDVEVVIVRGSFGGGPSARIHHDDGMEWFV